MNGPAGVQLHSATWWESQTHEQLQELIRIGYSGGEQYEGAHREVERRARESSRRAREATAARIQSRKDKAGRVAFGAALVSLIAAIASAAWVLFNR